MNTFSHEKESAGIVSTHFICRVNRRLWQSSKIHNCNDSDPEGARVEVNNDYIGKTPTTYTIAGNGDRSFNGNWVQGSMIEFVATPPDGETNLYVVKKSFRPSAFFQQGDHIPEKIFFDLRRKPEQFMLNFSPESK